MTTVLVRTEAALRALEPAWWALWRRVADASPFTSPAWLLPWWTVFHPGALFTVAVTAGDRLLALAPLYREDGVAGRRLLPLGISLSDQSDVLIDPDAPTAGMALLAALDGFAEDWDTWSAEELAPGAALLGLDPPGHWRAAVAAQSACPVLALPADAASLDTAVPPAQRRKWRMARHRIGRRSWRIEEADAALLPAALDHLFRLHGARWAQRGQAGVLADEDVRRFHHLAAPALLDAGLLRLRLLHIDDTVAGVYHGLHHGRRASAYLGGFDPAFAFESPGTVLLGVALEAAAGEGATAFDFLRGREPYKYAWGAVDRWNSRRLFEPRP